jgi:hypothetical protein
MDTVGLDELRIAYTAIPRCANTSIKHSLFKLATGKEFEGYTGDGPLWPHSTSKLEIHRNDIAEFTHLTENDKELIEANYDFWFTVVDTPIRRLFSSYYMFVLLEDPHLTVMGRVYDALPPLKEVNYSTIRAHFESFVESQFLKSLMEIDVHFMPQHKILCDFASSSKLRIYRLSEIERLKNDIDHFLFTNFFKGRLDIPRSNTSLISVDQLDISLKCRKLVESLYEEDVRMIGMHKNNFEQISKLQHTQNEENLMSIAVNEIRERNRRIIAIYLKHKIAINTLSN